jgi:hypothetical protein
MGRVEIEVVTALYLDIIITIQLLKARSQDYSVSKVGRRNISAYLDGELPPV